MSQFDTMYLDLCEKILNHGLKTEARNGITYRIPGNHWDFDLSKEFPILTVKKVGWKTAILEIMWIYQQKSIDVSWLRERGIKIWDKFEIGKDGIYINPDTGEETFFGKEWAGTIGTSYAYLIKNGGEKGAEDQMDATIYKIKNKPTDRRNRTTMWLPSYFHTAVLPPCVHSVTWNVFGDELHTFVEQRSCDTFIGVPFNITQYAALTCMVAHVTGLKPGTMHYNMVDVHIYEEHIEQVEEMLRRRDDVLPAPKLWLNPDVKDFYDFDSSKELKDIRLEGYEHLGALKGIVKA